MAKHPWTFFRAGGVDQVVLQSADDLKHLADLDQKLWVALACPIKGNELDQRSLELMDTDKDGRIRPPEVLEAIEWSAKVFKSLDLFFDKGAAVPLDQLDASTAEGKAVLASAKQILKEHGKKDAKQIELSDVEAMEKLFVATRFNGDGIIPADSADDEAVKKAIEDVIAALGSVTDRSGKPGIDQKLCDELFKQAAELLAWQDESRADGVLPLGDATAAAAAALDAVEAKVVDYFTRAKLASYDAKAAAALNAAESELAALSVKQLSSASEEVARLPIARVEGGKGLPLEAGVNPAWAAALATFAKDAVTPILGGSRSTLSEADFGAVVGKLAAHRAWRAKKPAALADKLGLARLRELVDGGSQAAISALIEKDASLQAEYLEIASVEKAIRYRRDLVKLLKNFVNFAEFYGKRGAMFQAGTLYLDARSCDLCMFVDDAGKHAALAGLAKAYLAYCDIKRAPGESAHIVAAFTAGDVDNLMVGRNGVFYDRKGNDWDATITKIVENPISVRQAFWSPYKRLVRLIEEQVAKRAAAKEAESTAKVDSAAVAAGNVDQTHGLHAEHAAAPPAPGAPPAAPAAPGAPPAVPGAPAPEKKLDLAVIVGLGVALGAIAGFLTSVLTMFLGLGIWMPVGLGAILLTISGPSMLIAWLKLRQRNLGPLLDASGWAVNGMAKINVPFGGALTDVAELPEGASRTAGDPFAEKPTPWGLYIALAIIAILGLVWLVGAADSYLPEKARFKTIVHANSTPSAAPSAGSAAPAAPPGPAPK